MTGTRNRIAQQVRRNPGIHFNELTRTLDLAPGQVQYHLRKLQRSDDVLEESLYRRNRPSASGLDPEGEGYARTVSHEESAV
jgi:predicted transcriptional regulator